MRKITEIIKEELRSAGITQTGFLYHLSYDKMEDSKNFDNYPDAKKYFLAVISKMPYSDIKSYNESSLLLGFSTEQPKLFDYLNKCLGEDFYFTLSLTSTTLHSGRLIPKVWNNPNKKLNNNFKEVFDTLDLTKIKKTIPLY